MSDNPRILRDRKASPATRSSGGRFGGDWIARPVFGVVLAGIVVWSLFASPLVFALLIGVITTLGGHEWHRMTGACQVILASAVTGVSIFAALMFLFAGGLIAAFAALLTGILVHLAVVDGSAGQRCWQALAGAYLGVPALALLGLRLFAPDGALLLVGLFIVIWAADTGGLIFGNLIGGARLVPRLSPNKTWAGTLGGIAVAALVEAVFVGMLHGTPQLAALYGGLIAIVAQAGDLFESWVKRRFNVKDSGALIPGHGGVLDRIDSTLLSAPVCAVLVFLLGFNPLFGAHL